MFQWIYGAFYLPDFQKFSSTTGWAGYCFKTCGWVFQILVHWGFEALIENQKLERELEKFSQVFRKLAEVIEKLGYVFVIYTAHGVPISHGKKY